MAEEHMGGGGDMDNGGMSEERVGAWQWVRGHVAMGAWAMRMMGVDVRSAWLIGFCTGTVRDISHVSRRVDGGWVVSVHVGHGQDASNVS